MRMPRERAELARSGRPECPRLAIAPALANRRRRTRLRRPREVSPNPSHRCTFHKTATGCTRAQPPPAAKADLRVWTRRPCTAEAASRAAESMGQYEKRHLPVKDATPPELYDFRRARITGKTSPIESVSHRPSPQPSGQGALSPERPG